MLDESELPQRLRRAVADEPPLDLELSAVLASGRRVRRRRRLAVTAGAAAAVAAVGAVAVPAVVAGDAGTRTTAVPPAAAPPARPDVDPLRGVDLSGASAAQRAEVADRTVTRDEFRAAFLRYRACMGAAGYDLGPVELTGDRFDYSVPDAAVRDGTDEECYRREHYLVDLVWQTSGAVLDASGTTELLRACLRERGIEPAASRGEVDAQLRAQGLELPDCLP
ncbi:hypothetical protein [Vallicoccus soli]|uniref:Uncharacterized protein n=1 Tax=Vallicoccus soli TaxID=2339232 RepID=A0A3A3Z0G8_9ACTN|nr:hypothetical protein [Vallicoccus soli]RJK97750.1 hypothetical protein D5H78_01770 [Vallicoccus soli]